MLPTFYSPAALSVCWSSRGNTFGLQSWWFSLLQTSLRMQSQSSGLTPPLSSHDSCPGYCCALLIPFILTFIPPQMRNYVWIMQKNPSTCLDLNLPFGFLSSSWFHGEPELFTHMFCAVLTHGTAASSVLCSEFLSCFIHKHKDIWPFCIDILCTFTFQALELMALFLCCAYTFWRVSFVRSSLSCSWILLNSL